MRERDYFALQLLLIALAILVGVLLSCEAHAKTIRVAVLDTGFIDTPEIRECPTGSHDFTGTGPVDDSPVRHGSNVAAIITRYAGSSNVCVMNLKVLYKDAFVARGYLAALKYLTTVPVDIVNLSLSGRLIIPEEKSLLRILLNQGKVIVVAAGNEGINMDYSGCIIYPACSDPRIIVVGNISPRSNRGKVVDAVVPGIKVYGAGVWLTGTSQSAAIMSGQIAREAARLESNR